MSRKQENSFGVVARTGFSLLALGFGSALFGALVVGPMLGKSVAHDRRSAARPAASETQLASSVMNDSDTASGRRSARAVETEAEPEREEKAEAKSEFAEGPGAEVAVSTPVGSYAGPTEDPDATSTDVVGEHAEPEAPKTTVRSDPFSNPSPVKVDAPKPIEAPKVVEPPKERAVAEPETPKRSERTERRDDEARKVTRDGERTREREARSRRPEETTREQKSERHEDRAPVRDERKSSRDRVAEEPTRRRTDEERVSARPEASSKREKVEKTRTAKASETPSETDAEQAEETKLYRVRVGRVHPRERAEKLRDELKDVTGVEAFLVPVGEGFQIQTGAYKRKANADKIAATLRAGNFITVVRQDP